MCGLKTALARHLIQSAQGKAGTRWAFPLKFYPPCAAEGIGLARTAHSDGGPPYAFYSAPSQGGSYPGCIPGAPAQKNTGSMRFVQRLRCGEFEKSENCRLAVSSIGWSLVRRPDIREEEYRPRNGNGRARFYPGRPWEFHRLPCPGQKDRFVQPQLKRFHQTVVLSPVFAGPSHGENRSGENCFGCGADIKFQDHDSNR